MSVFLTVLSEIVGWIYFVSWSISFYPVAWTNFKLQQTAGMSIDYAFFNVFGYFLYAIYTFTGLIYPDIGTHHVAIQDVFYVGHAIMLSSLYYTQTCIYPNGGQKISMVIWGLLVGMTLTVAIVFILEMNNIGVNQYWNTAML